MTRKIIFGILFSAWLIIIILLSVWPGASSSIQQDVAEFHWDYLEHFLFYFILGFLYMIWRMNHDLLIPFPELIIFLIAGTIFSILIEYIQVFIPGRAFTRNDMISNIIGFISGTLISYFIFVRILLRNWLKKKNQFTNS